MKTIKEVLNNYEEYQTSLEDRFGKRFCDFLTEEQGKQIGFTIKEGYEWGEPKEWTKKNIIEQLKEDIEFGLEKAEGERGISASLMFEVVKSWLKILEDNEMLENFDDYYDYGKDAFKEAYSKYNSSKED